MMDNIINSNESFPLFGHYLIRGVLLEELLGDKKEQILYWAGKKLARQYPLHSIDEFSDFFAKSGWGNLILIKEGKAEVIFELQSIFLSYQVDPAYQLEAGFLAEQFQTLKGCIAEAAIMKKRKKVLISVKWDAKDKIKNI